MAANSGACKEPKMSVPCLTTKAAGFPAAFVVLRILLWRKTYKWMKKLQIHDIIVSNLQFETFEVSVGAKRRHKLPARRCGYDTIASDNQPRPVCFLATLARQDG